MIYNVHVYRFCTPSTIVLTQFENQIKIIIQSQKRNAQTPR